MMQLTSGAAPGTKIVIKGGLRKQLPIAEEFKQQGNSYFVSLEYPNAIECYSKCLDALENHPSTKLIEKPLEMKMLVYSNRAQAFLKLKCYQKAYNDAKQATALDP
jgi:tetratricopeptide (TPR) repeat protein